MEFSDIPYIDDGTSEGTISDELRLNPKSKRGLTKPRRVQIDEKVHEIKTNDGNNAQVVDKRLEKVRSLESQGTSEATSTTGLFPIIFIFIN